MCSLSPLTIFVLIVWLVSAVGLVIFVLLHSGKGTGMSDMIAAQMYNRASSTSIVERNLDRITVVFVILFVLSLLALVLLYPVGTVTV